MMHVNSNNEDGEEIENNEFNRNVWASYNA